jgi:hypothetical protein
MASLAQPANIPSSEEVTAAETALIEAFYDILETIPPEQQKALIADLRANAEAHGQ